ncbi:MAG: hypothetical protein AAF438_15065, partial [Pseudomonadota bacterium]
MSNLDSKKIRSMARGLRWARYQIFGVYAFGVTALCVVLLKRFSDLSWLTTLSIGAAAGTCALAVLAWRGWQSRVTPVRYAHHLDDMFPEFDDSAELLLKRPKQLSPLQLHLRKQLQER